MAIRCARFSCEPPTTYLAGIRPPSEQRTRDGESWSSQRSRALGIAGCICAAASTTVCGAQKHMPNLPARGACDEALQTAVSFPTRDALLASQRIASLDPHPCSNFAALEFHLVFFHRYFTRNNSVSYTLNASAPSALYCRCSPQRQRMRLHDNIADLNEKLYQHGHAGFRGRRWRRRGYLPYPLDVVLLPKGFYTIQTRMKGRGEGGGYGHQLRFCSRSSL